MTATPISKPLRHSGADADRTVIARPVAAGGYEGFAAGSSWRWAPALATAAAGLPAGAVVTRVDAQSISNAEALVAAVHSKAPGATIAVNYFDPSGGARTSQVLLGTDQGQQS